MKEAKKQGKPGKKIPKFERQNRAITKRVGSSWRKPRGIDNKLRVQKRGTGAMPRIGYRKPRDSRGFHPSGRKEVLVHNPRELEGLKNGEGVAVRIGRTVGKKKSEAIRKAAREKGLKVLN